MKRSREEAIEFLRDIAIINGHSLLEKEEDSQCFLYCKHCTELVWDYGQGGAIYFFLIVPCGQNEYPAMYDRQMFLEMINREFEGDFY